MDAKLVLLSAVAASLVTSGIWWALGPAPAPRERAAAERTQAALPSAPTREPGTASAMTDADRLLDRVAALEARAVELEWRLVAAEERRAAVLAEGGQGAEGPQPTAQAAPARELVLSVLAEERAREAAEREQERVQRFESAVLDRGERIAERLELAPADRETLLALLQEEADRGRDALAALMDRDSSREERQIAMEQARAVREWTRAELDIRFTPETAARIAENMRGFGFDGRDRGRGNRAPAGAAGDS